MTSKFSAFQPMPRERLVTQEGYPFIVISAAVCLFTVIAAWTVLASIFVLLTLFVCFFFRNPKREAPQGDDIVIAPADGRIIAIESAGGETKVSTFMSVFNCHVNRVPVSGRVEDVNYRPGKFFVASLDKASEHNERNTIVINDRSGRRVRVVQIAGVVARRIICYLQNGFEAGKGSRLGLIRFGSRVDIFLPSGGFDLLVKKGDRVRAGETVLGRWR